MNTTIEEFDDPTKWRWVSRSKHFGSVGYLQRIDGKRQFTQDSKGFHREDDIATVPFGSWIRYTQLLPVVLHDFQRPNTKPAYVTHRVKREPRLVVYRGPRDPGSATDGYC